MLHFMYDIVSNSGWRDSKTSRLQDSGLYRLIKTTDSKYLGNVNLSVARWIRVSSSRETRKTVDRFAESLSSQVHKTQNMVLSEFKVCSTVSCQIFP